MWCTNEENYENYFMIIKERDLWVYDVHVQALYSGTVCPVLLRVFLRSVIWIWC